MIQILEDGAVYVLVPLVYLLGVAAAVHALFHVRTPQGSVAWALALGLVPWIALPAYLVFGRRHISLYVRALRRARLLTEDERTELSAPVRALLDRHTVAAATEEPLRRLAGTPIVTGHRARLLVDGEATYDALLDRIGAAERRVHFQFFTIHSDEVGERFGRALTHAAERGVEVRVLYDEVGSRGLSGAWVAGLRRAGAEVSSFGRRGQSWGRSYVNFRNHRKLVVVDGRVAFVGGHNVGDEYLGRSPALRPWRDTHLELEGPSVVELELVFAQDWFFARGELLDLPVAATAAGSVEALPLPTGPFGPHPSCELVAGWLVERARRRLWWATPYFVPTPGIVLALRLAALRGVDVRILLPRQSDHLLSTLAAFAALHELADSPIRFFRRREGFSHQKVVLVDDDLATVGSANLDSRSLLLNLELGVLLRGGTIVEDVERMLRRDLEASVEVTDEYARLPLHVRFGARIARTFAPVL
ncbi:MAG: cardiolipin synthase [Sandaracinaceae bacterium]